MSKVEINRQRVYSNGTITINYNYNFNFYSAKIPVVLSRLHNSERNERMDIHYSKTISIKAVKLFEGPCNWSINSDLVE